MTTPALRPPSLAAVATLTGLLGLGCGMLDARLQAQTVCFTLSDYTILGAPGGAGPLTTDITYDLAGDLPILSQPDVRYTLVLESVRLSAGASSPAVDLGGIDTLDVSVIAPPGSSLPEPVLVSYVKGADPHPSAISAGAASGDDLAPYVAGGQIAFRATADGTLPSTAWTADVTGCFLLTVDVNYGKKL